MQRIVCLTLALLAVNCETRGQALVDTNGMSKVWETIYSAFGLAPKGDADRDGESNYQESIAGTDPYDPQAVFQITACSVISPAYLLRWQSVAGVRYQVQEAGVLGQWTAQGDPWLGTGQQVLAAVPADIQGGASFFTLSVVTDNPAIEWSRPYIGNIDTDGDGIKDIDEFAAGTNPMDPTSRLAVTNVQLGRAMVLQWPSVSGKYYQVKARASLSKPWISMGGTLAGTGSNLCAAVEVITNLQYFGVQVFDLDSDHDGATDWEQGMAGIAPGFYYGPGAHNTNPPPNAVTVAAMLKAINVVNVTPSVPVADATTFAAGSFRLVRTGNLNPITVQYTVGGTAIPGVDYEPLSGMAQFGAGVNVVEIPVTPLSGENLEQAQDVSLTLNTAAGYTLGTNTTADVRVVQELVLSVQDFGTTGDGITDDTMAIQAAISALEASSNYNTLFFPAGAYRLNTPYLRGSNPVYDILELGQTDLAGRDLFFVGDTNVVLYSTVSWLRARMLMVYGSFRSLSFRNLTFQKISTAFPYNGDTANADGIFVNAVDQRRVESLDITNCTFNNCHGSVTVNGLGQDLRGQLAHFHMVRCNLLNPYGSNMTNAAAAYGGGVQVYLNSWVGEAVYNNNLFDGGPDTPNPSDSSSSVNKDGSHFGSPLSLVFTNNVVLNMGVEAVMQTDDPLMSTTISDFTVPPAGTRQTNVIVLSYPSTYRPGQILNFRTWPASGGDPVNILLAAVGYNAKTSSLSVTNPGLSAGAAGMLIPANMPIYAQDYPPAQVLISANQVLSPSLNGGVGICSDAKSTITHNFVRGYDVGIYLYPSDHTPYRPPTPGTLIASNIIDAPNIPIQKYGIVSYGPGVTLLQNLIIKESTNSFCGISLRCTNSWIRGNTIISRKIGREPYNFSIRSVGVSFIGSSETTSMDNRTYGMDVGIGPEIPYAVVPHRVISHSSYQDTLSIDPLGVY